MENDHPPEFVSQEDAREALRLLDLIQAEWQSDPSAVAAFDLHVIVNPVADLVDRYTLL